MSRLVAHLAPLVLLCPLAVAGSLPAFASPPEPLPLGAAAALTAPPEVSPQSAGMNVSYLEDWPAEARQAFDYAAGIWSPRLNSTVPVAISAYWTPTGYFGACECQPAWVTLNETLYPAALANAIAGYDTNGAAFEMMVTCNSDRSDWYLGLDENPGPYRSDFVTVVAHELGHGLGLSSLMSVNWQGLGTWDAGSGHPTIYDRFLANSAGLNLITTYASPSRELGDQLTSDDVFFAGPSAIANNGGAMPRLHAPSPWAPGASISHLDEDTYGGTQNALMTPSLARGEAYHDPGPVALGMLQDLGWDVNAPPPPLPPGLTESRFLPLILSP